MSEAADEQKYVYWELGALHSDRLDALVKSDSVIVSDTQFLLGKLMVALPVSALAVVWIVTKLFAGAPLIIREIALPQVSSFLSLLGFIWLSVLLSYAITFSINALSGAEPIIEKTGWSTHVLQPEMKTEASWYQTINKRLLTKTMWLRRARRFTRNGFVGAFYMNMAALVGVVGQHFGG